jgi:hypothetical protein
MILVAQWKLFMSYVNHDSARGLVRRFQGGEGTKRKEIYTMLVEVKKVNFLAKK